METIAHQQLKREAARFLRGLGCGALAMEVRCPIGRFRVDVAGYLDRRVTVDGEGREQRKAAPPRTVVIECKQSRGDFLRDRAHAEKLLRRREQLERIRRSIEEHHIKPEEPHLRRGGSALFAELESWDFHKSRMPAYRKVLRQLARLDAQLHGEVKFHLMARYALADRLYLATPPGLLRRCEVPPGWGLLECAEPFLEDGDVQLTLDGTPAVTVRVKAPVRRSPAKFRQRLLRNIAVAASYAAERAR